MEKNKIKHPLFPDSVNFMIKNGFDDEEIDDTLEPMYNQFFEKKMDYGRLEDIVFLTKSEVIGDYDTDKKIYSVATLKNAKENDISFLTNSK